MIAILISLLLFWQYLKYADADIIITPSPLHGEEGMIEWYFSKPKGWYEEIAARRGDFRLSSFWGPLASFATSRGICRGIAKYGEMGRYQLGNSF